MSLATNEQDFPRTCYANPLLIEGLERGRFIRMEQKNGEVTAVQNEYNTWAWNYEDLLTRLFGFQEDRATSRIVVERL